MRCLVERGGVRASVSALRPDATKMVSNTDMRVLTFIAGYKQCSKWNRVSAGTLLKSETRIYRQKNGKRQTHIVYVDVSVLNSGTKTFHYDIPVHFELWLYVQYSAVTYFFSQF
jgi:hypothetical protein